MNGPPARPLRLQRRTAGSGDGEGEERFEGGEVGDDDRSSARRCPARPARAGSAPPRVCSPTVSSTVATGQDRGDRRIVAGRTRGGQDRGERRDRNDRRRIPR